MTSGDRAGDYLLLARTVAERFGDGLGARLRSVFVRGSVARGDPIWGVSDMDVVLWFDDPTAADNRLKRTVERELKMLPGGRAVVIQRLDERRLDQMDVATGVYWRVSSIHDCLLIRGEPPSALIPAVPEPERIATLLTPLMIKDGDLRSTNATLSRVETRHLAKRTLNLLTMPVVASGLSAYIPPRAVGSLNLPPEIQTMVPAVLSSYEHAPDLPDPTDLQRAWAAAKAWVRAEGL